MEQKKPTSTQLYQIKIWLESAFAPVLISVDSLCDIEGCLDQAERFLILTKGYCTQRRDFKLLCQAHAKVASEVYKTIRGDDARFDAI